MAERLTAMHYQRLVPVFPAGLILAIYAAVYYATPLSVMPSGPEGVPRRTLLLTYLLRPDDLVREWLGSPPALAVLDRLPVLLLAAGIVGMAAALGRLAIRLVGADRGLDGLERFVFSAGVGLNLVSTYILAVGLAGWMNAMTLFYVPAAAAVGAAAWMYRGLRWRKAESADSGRSIPRKGRRNRSGRSESAAVAPADAGRAELLGTRWLWLMAPFAAVIVLGGMLPPIEFDVREYHLQVPKEFFRQGRITFLPHNVYGNMAMGTEILSLPAMAAAGDWWLGALAGKTLIALFAPLTALALFAAGRRFFSTTAGVVAAVLYVSMPWVVQVSMLGLVDAAVGCYLVLALYALLLHARGQDQERQAAGRAWSEAESRLLLAGYLAGAAVATKYPAALFVAVPLTAAVAWMQVRRWWRTAWKPLAVFVLAAVAGCGLWFGKNWALTGNPAYPLLYEVFGGETRTAEKDEQWTRAHRPHVFTTDALLHDLGRVLLTSPWLSPLLVPMAGLAFLNRRYRRMAAVLAAYFAFVILAWWVLTHRIDRFWIPAIPLLTLMGGIAATASAGRGWKVLLVIVLVFTACANFVVAASPLIADNRFFAPLARLRDDPLRMNPWHRWFNAEAPDGCILMIGEAQVFDLVPRVIYSTCFDSSVFEEIVKGHSAEEIRRALRSRGITHVYVHWGEIARYRATYGYTDFVQPEVFERLIREGILEPLPPIEDHPSRAYRVW